MYGPRILSGKQFNIYANEINVFIKSKKETHKICSFEPIFKYENSIPTSQNDSYRKDLKFRKDNNLVWKSFEYGTRCKILRDGISMKEHLTSLANSIVYHNTCNDTCFTLKFNKNTKMKAIAIWFKINETIENVTKSLCLSSIILTSIVYDSNSICKNIFKRDTGISEVYMVYANCNESIFINKYDQLLISLDIKSIKLVEIAVYNAHRIEHLTLIDKVCIDTNVFPIQLINKSSKGNFIDIILYYQLHYINISKHNY